MMWRLERAWHGLAMRFNLVDRIVELDPGRRIRTVKSLTLSEEYLADHFRSFPVMPGVLMLECLAQSAGWLVRATEGFAHSVVTLAEVKNATFKSFITPGQVLTADLECKRLGDQDSEFVARGFRGPTEIVKARLQLEHRNLADRDAALAAVDRELVGHAKAQFALIGGDCFVSMAATS